MLDNQNKRDGDECSCCSCGNTVLQEEPKKDNGGRVQLIRTVIGSVFLVTAIIVSYILQHEVLSLIFYLASYIILGGKVLYKASRNLLRGKIFDENFLMSIATIGALAIGEYPEAVAVMLFYLIGEYFQDKAVRRSRRSIASLMDIRPDFANIQKDGQIIQVNPNTLEVGDTIIVKPGEKIPVDGIVTDGCSALDTRALTGEAVPREINPGDTVLSGCVNQSGTLTVEVTKKFGESTAVKILELVENATAKKAPTENFITTFSKYYTPFVVAFAVLLAVLPPLLFDGLWEDWIHRALVFLVISCPCALVISVPLSFFAGIGNASSHGILVKGGNYLEALNRLNVVVFDKTGTLTEGVFDVTHLYPAEGITQEELLEFAAYAEYFSKHPIAQSISRAYGKEIDANILSNHTETSGYGTAVSVKGKLVLAGSDRFLTGNNIGIIKAGGGGTKIYVAVDGKFAGSITISDKAKQDSRNTISALKELGVRKTIMLTGDSSQIAESMKETLGLDEVYSELLPNQKVEKIEQLEEQKQSNEKIAFVGDGINDAPVLARADVGIAMGGLGSDAAIEAADIVLMTDEPSKLITAIKIAKRTKMIVTQNIVFALGIKTAFLVLGAFGFSGMWEAVFADIGVSVIAIFNALRIMR